MTKVNCTNEDCVNNKKGICLLEEIICSINDFGGFVCLMEKKEKKEFKWSESVRKYVIK